MKLLHVVATPREGESNTLRVADAFLKVCTPSTLT